MWRNQPYHPVASVILISVTLFIVTAIGLSAAPEAQPCMDDEQRERVRFLMLQGFDAAFQTQVGQLFTVWVKDNVDEPKRAVTGLHADIRAYTRARTAALKWNPPYCEEKK
jgi:hypothetical protein